LTLRDLTRKAALSIPRVGRFYDYARSTQEELTDLQQDLRRVEEKLNAAREELNAAKEELNTAREELQSAAREKEALTRDLSTAWAANQRLTDEKDAVAHERDALNRELASARGVVDGALNRRQEIQTQLYLLRSDFQRTVSNLEATRANAEEVRREKDATAAQAAELESKLAEAEKALQQERRLIDHVSAFRSELETYSSRLLARISIVSSDLDTLHRVVKPNAGSGGQAVAELRRLYLDLLEKALIGSIYEDKPISFWSDGYDPDVRVMGRDWPATAQSMIGAARMRNIRTLVERILDQNIPGDLLEAGVWRGGACIYMRGILEAYGVTDRTVWVADSFEGLPPPMPEAYPADAKDIHHTFKELAVSIDEVKSYFARYGFLDERVVFVKGWFKDTLPGLPVEKLALLRLDGDMYQSTMEALNALYAKVSLGGFVIIDDYILKPCRQAVDDFRHKHNIEEPIEAIDGAGVYWRKKAEPLEQPHIVTPAAAPIRRGSTSAA
jgi:predicted  nucleic acid-binding Zn-ribbon protein